MPSVAQRRANVALLFSIAITVFLYFVPLGSALAYPLVLLSTLAHELGHGLAAVAMGCSFDRFVLFADGSGAAMTSGNPGRFASAFISAGGLVGPAVAAAGCFEVGRRARTARAALLLAGVLLAVAVLLLIRNLFGVFFVGTLAGLCIFIGTKGSAEATQFTTVFLGVQMALSVFSRSDYLFTDVAQTQLGAQPSDVAHIATALFFPYWFWGLVCGAFSLGVLWLGLKNFLGAGSR
jgi:hypothetical protein